MTVIVFYFLLIGNGSAATWHAREFWRHAQQKRLKLAQIVLFTGPLGWCSFVGREWHFISVQVASVLVWFAVVGTVLHLLAIWSQVSQRLP